MLRNSPLPADRGIFSLYLVVVCGLRVIGITMNAVSLLCH